MFRPAPSSRCATRRAVGAGNDGPDDVEPRTAMKSTHYRTANGLQMIPDFWPE